MSVEQALLKRHQRTDALLPWYVNGTLSAVECAEVDAHLGECVTCMREVRFLHAVGREVSMADAPTLAPRGGFARLAARIEAAEQTPRRIPVAVAAGVGALLVGASLLFASLNRDEAARGDAQFRTLSADPSVAVDAMLMKVVCAADVPAARCLELLSENALSVIAGPGGNGVYTARAATVARAHDAQTALRASREVDFVALTGPDR